MNLGKKITTGLVWTYLERLLAQGVSTIVTIILARLLLPEQYGVVSIVTVFISICDTLVVGGFSDTLIQKKDADDYDFSTLFWFVLFIGFVMYGVVYAIAPFVEQYSRTAMVCVTLRVMAIRLPINAIKSIQSAYISRKMEYRYFFFATLFGTIVSAFVGVAMAYAGKGVWALVAQYLTNSIIDTIIIWITCGWRPHFTFRFDRLRVLYSFGWKMQLSSLISTVYSELESLSIAGKYTSTDLAFYDKGRQFPRLIMHNVQTSISKVMLPVFSSINENLQKAKSMAKRSISISTFLMTPLIVGLMAVATDFVSVVLTDKWLPSVPYLRLLSIYYLMQPLMSLNKQIVIAFGEAKLYLKMEMEKKVIGIILLALALLLTDSVLMVAVAIVITQIIGLFIQSYPLKRMLNYSMYEQLCDALPAFINSGIMALVVLGISIIPVNKAILLSIEIIVGAIVYIVLSFVQKNESLNYLIDRIKRLKKTMV